MKPSRFTYGALFLCIFLGLFTEVLLSPFYPQFFSKVFGVEDLSYTGYYIFMCRLAVVLSAPLWGVLARWVELKWVLYVGQTGTAVMTALMATASSIEQFLGFTLCMLFFKSSYLLIYPLIIQLAGKDKRATVAGSYQAVFHGAIVSATVAGAGMVNLDNPLTLFYWIAVADLFQLGLSLYALRGVSTRKEVAEAGKQPKAVGDRWGFILAMGLVIFSFQLANQVVRPFFTKYVTSSQPFDVSLFASSFLFLIPSLMAIAAMPYIHKVGKPERLPRLYGVGICLLVASLYFQGLTNHLSLLVFSRVVYGFFLAVTQATLELQLFSNSSQKRLHFNYSLATSFANAGHLCAPLFASWLVSAYSLATPLIAAATLGIFNLLFARFTVFGTVSNFQTVPVSKKESS
ncbi:MAG: MFS transporter [Cyanobacteria bacterium SW_6_48_11]|nr:MAG: MFS transporter [Cyanobacteria bacterium SW_6_48_11]